MSETVPGWVVALRSAGSWDEFLVWLHEGRAAEKEQALLAVAWEGFLTRRGRVSMLDDLIALVTRDQQEDASYATYQLDSNGSPRP